MKRLERLTALLSLLQSRSHTPLAVIEAKFDISERTVFRDLKALEEAGVPISFEKDRGYFILDRHFLAPLAFTPQEAKSFILVEQLARKYTDQETFRHYESALEKIKNKLGNQQLADIEAMESRVTAYINPDFTPQFLHRAETACSERQVLRLHYENAQGQRSERLIEPIGMTFYSQSWHLIAYCRLRKAYRDFSLARIKQLQPTGEIFPAGRWSLEEYIRQLE